MEVLPVEIADKILDQIFHENPQDLYQLRVVSKTWKDLIDRCTSWLLKVWCAKCLEKIPEICLDDIVHTKFPQFASWQDYCSNEFSLPHIARDIYESRNEFPNLVGKLHSTEFILSSETRIPVLLCYAVNDKYVAMSSLDAVRIYSLISSDIIREYSISCDRMDFYKTDNWVFIVLEKSDNYEDCEPIYLAEFLVDDRLVPSNLPSTSDFVHQGYYVITENQCFTFNNFTKSFQHQRLIANGLFNSSRNIEVVPPEDYSYNRFTFTEMRISDSTLWVSVDFGWSSDSKDISILAYYHYQIIRQLNGELSFSDPQIYQQNIIFSLGGHLRSYTNYTKPFLLTFAAENNPVQNKICHIYPKHLSHWMGRFFDRSFIWSLIIHTNHVLIPSDGKFVIFRGNLQQLMDCAENEIDPGSRCTVIDMDLELEMTLSCRDNIRVIHVDSKPKFLINTNHKIFIIDFIP